MANISINSNLASLQAQRRLSQTTNGVRTVFQRLSSGQRINRASDDAAGLAISDSMRTDRRVYNQGLRNFNDGISMLSIGESAIAELTNIVTRIKELAEQAANGTLGNTQRKALDAEAQSLSKEYLRISQVTAFNGQKMFDGSVQGLILQGGYGSNGGLQFSTGGAIGTGYFNSPITEATNQTTDISIGDLNGDGINDLILADYGVNSIAVLLGNGNGTFKASQTFSTGKGYNFTISDFNNDGFLDSAMVAWPNSGFAVNLGNGDGTFGAKSFSFTNDYVENITSGDLNGDGFVDIVTTNNTDDSLSVALGNGNGSFKSPVDYYTDSNPMAAAINDVNRDGINDIVTFNVGTGSVSVFIGNGNGSFKSKVDYPEAGFSLNNGELVDLNGDGNLDIVGIDPGNTTANVMFGNGNGSFKTCIGYTVQSGAQDITIADFNGDGFQDLATSSDLGEISILINNGNGSFKPQTVMSAGSFFRSITAGDLNGDGVADLVAADYSTNHVAVLLAKTVDGVNPLPTFSLKTRADALQAMVQMTTALKNRALQRGVIGAYQSRIEAAASVLSVSSENLAAAESRIRDTDVADESATLVRLGILQQATAAVLSQANQQPALALALLGAL